MIGEPSAELPEEPESERPWWAWGCSAGLTGRDRGNLLKMYGWFLLWFATWIAAALSIRSWAADLPRVGMALVVGPALLWIPTIRAGLRFLREADELTRKIQLQGMAVGFVAALVFAFTYPMLETVTAGLSGVPWLHGSVEAVDPPMATVFAWAITLVVLQRRYA